MYNTLNQVLWLEGSVCYCVTILTRNDRRKISKFWWQKTNATVLVRILASS
jgi:hypothetical protein